MKDVLPVDRATAFCDNVGQVEISADTHDANFRNHFDA
jgi:hypothetical protein